ncbi:hypothetical protein E1B28_005382 [Marasmius oreades]|uniref:Uncharacterized protein n=1 Tax=Marasmius oreades TaxID=181124 RepID=A0A9P7S315_9AGAR|nr:uncharacterized protein E1B28_005382 [Marasmius oreades]KAG7094554.1 hypothetical protein E1B28_005382 [Marasmius oreades]
MNGHYNNTIQDREEKSSSLFHKASSSEDCVGIGDAVVRQLSTGHRSFSIDLRQVNHYTYGISDTIRIVFGANQMPPPSRRVTSAAVRGMEQMDLAIVFSGTQTPMISYRHHPCMPLPQLPTEKQGKK